MSTEIAKVFWSGRSQAVRLPKEFRLSTNTVRISRHGNTILLEAIPENWDWLDEIAGKLDQDFIHATQEQSAPQKHTELDTLFK